MAPTAPMMATEASAVGAGGKSPLERAIKYTPAGPLGPAWIGPRTGVGPSMAAGGPGSTGSCPHFPPGPCANQKQHREEKQVRVAEGGRVARVSRHVADGVDVDQEAHAGDDEQHHARQRIDQDSDRDVERAGVDPAIVREVVELRGRRFAAYLE